MFFKKYLRPSLKNLVNNQYMAFVSGMALVTSATVLISPKALAITFNFSPNNINRIIGGSFSNTHFDDLFSANGSNNQRTLVQTTTNTFLSALITNLGILNTDQSYRINSAKLIAGNDADDFAISVRGFEIIVPYDPSTVTFANFNNGGVAGVDYNSTAAAVGVVTGSTTSWDFTSVVRGYLQGNNNLGLFFEGSQLIGAVPETAVTNVRWSIDAEIVTNTQAPSVPEPSSLFGFMAVGGFLLRQTYSVNKKR